MLYLLLEETYVISLFPPSPFPSKARTVFKAADYCEADKLTFWRTSAPGIMKHFKVQPLHFSVIFPGSKIGL